MPKPIWQWQADAEGIDLCLMERPLLGRARPVPLADWATRQPAAAAAVARLARLIDDQEGEAVPTVQGCRLSHGALADVDEAMALSLGLPPAPPFLLRLVPQGLITDGGFTVEPRFVGLGDAPLRPTPKREGTILRYGDAAYRLPRQLVAILDAVEALAATASAEAGPAARMTALARLKALLPDIEQRWVQADGYLRTIRVAVPSAFSLRLSTKDGRFDVDPVLFGREAMNDEPVPLREERALLPPAEDEAFRRQFRARGDVAGAYALARGTYLFLPPALQAALEIVREVQGADAKLREAFARQPHRFLAERLASRGDLGSVETLFLETEQYSERVVGLGLWRPPVLPWLVRTPNGWLPERFGLRVGDREVEIPLERLGETRAALERAITASEPEAAVPGIGAIPATPQARTAIAELERQLGRASGPEPTEAKDSVEADALARGGKLVLLTRDNLEEIGFRRELTPRSARAPDRSPSTLMTALKQHQRQGLLWLQEMWRAGESGALLADDMGLGKTVQALAFLGWLREAGAVGPFLVVAPTGLLANWRAEEEKHLAQPGLGEIAAAFGLNLRRLKLDQGSEALGAGAVLKLDELRQAGWILTTYETLRDHEQSFGKLKLACVVLDELQRAKNPASLVHKAVTALNADFALGLTGTPVENRIEDLWAVMEPVRPGELGDLREFSRRHSPEDLGALEGLRVRLLEGAAGRRASVLRRLKADALDGLPEKHTHRRPALMPPAQAEAYAKLVAEARAGRLDGLRTLHHLRGISLHPQGCGPDLGDEEWVTGSARLGQALTVLDEVAERGEKALLFCESLDVQERLGELLRRRYRLPRRPAQVTGEIAGAKRQAAVDAFQTAGRGFDVMLLTPRAGGVGLTLTAANHVVHLSRWWNPAVEDQCTDRIFRIGQERPVHVWYPLALHPSFPGGSFDEALDALLERKRLLTHRLLVPPVGPRDEAELLRVTVDLAVQSQHVVEGG